MSESRSPLPRIWLLPPKGPGAEYRRCPRQLAAMTFGMSIAYVERTVNNLATMTYTVSPTAK